MQTADVFGPVLKVLVEDLQKDDTTMLEIANLFAKMCDPYVPFLEGVLSQSGFAQVKPGLVTYGNDQVPYAHYLYEGEIYGPNIPIKDDGEIVGWFSPPGQKKNPTGRQMTYTTDYHPRATAHWDEVMMQEKRDEFNAQVEQILIRRANELWG